MKAPKLQKLTDAAMHSLNFYTSVHQYLYTRKDLYNEQSLCGHLLCKNISDGLNAGLR